MSLYFFLISSIFLRVYGISFFAPKPGFTVITRTWSTSGMYGKIFCEGVFGFIASPTFSL